MGALSSIDRRVSRRIHALELGRLDYLLAAPTLAFGEWGMPVVWVALGMAFGWRYGLALALCSLALAALTSALKRLAARTRPQPLAPRALALRALATSPSFPSGDSAQAGLVTALLILAGPLEDPRRWLFLPLAPCCMFGRVYFGAHWVGDTVVGVLLGVGVAVLARPFF